MFLFGPRAGEATADLAETLVKRLIKCIPSGATEEISARQLVVDLRGFILGPTPSTHDGMAQVRKT
jgi:hypothetical protein